MGFMRGEGGSGGGGGGVPTLTASRAVVTNGSGALATADVTAAEIGYLNGVTSAIQTQLNAKAPLASPTFTGTPAAPTAAADTNTTQIATTAMVQAAIANAVVGLLELKGSTDASANPNYPAASKGDAYTISVAGKVGGASGKTVEVGDVIVATADNAGGAEASVGTSWTVWQANLVGALLGSNNLSDLASAETARNNLGLGAADVVTFEKLIARQDGGVAGTDDVEVYHDGSNGYANSKSGTLRLTGGAPYFVVEMLRTLQMFSGDEFTGNPTLIADALNGQFKFNNAFRVSWSQSASGFDVRDIGLARKSSGLLQVTAGDSGVADIESRQFISTQTTGTAPLTVASTTVVTNLNADKLDGLDAADLVAKSLVTTKGDLIAASGSATPARLPIGTNGQVLTADSAQTLGVKWADAAGGDSIATPKVAYVETTGDNATAAIGNPTKPYATLQAAIDAVEASAESGVVVVGVGVFAGYSGPALDRVKAIHGRGRTATYLGGLTFNYAGSISQVCLLYECHAGTITSNAQGPSAGGNTLTIEGANCYIADAQVNGGNGVDGDSENAGGSGGAGGQLYVRGAIELPTFSLRGGLAGFDGGLGTGSPGTHGTAWFNGVQLRLGGGGGPTYYAAANCACCAIETDYFAGGPAYTDGGGNGLAYVV